MGLAFNEDGTGASSYYDYSGMTGATPDGRKDLDLFNDGTVSRLSARTKKDLWRP